MRITKCDLCKKQIKNEPVTAGRGFFKQIELCEGCGSPVLKFLKRHKIFTEYKKTKKKK